MRRAQLSLAVVGRLTHSLHLPDRFFVGRVEEKREECGALRLLQVSRSEPLPGGFDRLANFAATEPWIFEDVDQSPLLTRPTGVRSHPRTLFDSDAPEADLIRQWASVQR